MINNRSPARHYSELAKSFSAQTIDPGQFRHIDHMGVAYELFRGKDFVHVSRLYSDSIRGIALKAGVAEKFNMTMTVAFLSLIAERMHTTPHNDFADFVAKNPDLKSKNVLDHWYSPERLQSNLAREVFLLPDGRY